jgi:hypothetical protein
MENEAKIYLAILVVVFLTLYAFATPRTITEPKTITGGVTQYYSTCEDSDNGINVQVQAAVTGMVGQEAFSYVDSCTENGKVLEYYCDGNQWASYAYTCEPDSWCIDGACE